MPDVPETWLGAAAGGCEAKALGAGDCGCWTKLFGAGDSAGGGASFIAETKGEPKGIAGAVAMSEGTDARCCAAGVNKVEMDACG